MRAAKMQASDLDHIEKTFNSIVVPGETTQTNEDSSPTGENKTRQQPSKPRSLRNDNIARFGEPPAPPPQQPLPEKPDAAKPTTFNSLSLTGLLKRTETARPGNSPGKSEPTSVLDYVTALELVKKDLDSHKARVKELEDQLKEEKTARVEAEERARKVEQVTVARPVEKVEEVSEADAATESPRATVEETQTKTTENSDQQLQQRLDTMVAEMQKMKNDMDNFQQRAETAEKDASKARETLAEMIERLRQENASEAYITADSVATMKPARSRNVDSSSAIDGASKQKDTSNGHVRTPKLPAHLESAVATALRQSNSGNGEVLAQSAPYMSMLGVVLIGVGLMAYLNSWQKTDK